MNSCIYRIHYPDHYFLQLRQKLSSPLISAVNARTILATHSCSYCKHYPRYLVLQLLQRLRSPLTLAVTAKTNLAVKLRNYCKNYPRHEFMQLPHKLSSPLIFAATAKTILAMKFCSYCRNYPRHEFLRLLNPSEPARLPIRARGCFRARRQACKLMMTITMTANFCTPPIMRPPCPPPSAPPFSERVKRHLGEIHICVYTYTYTCTPVYTCVGLRVRVVFTSVTCLLPPRLACNLTMITRLTANF